MKSFFQELNNRELAVAIWIGLLLIAMAFAKDVRHSMGGIIKSFFVKKVFFIFLSIALYSLIIISLLYVVEYWNKTLLKDSVFWFFGTAFLLIFKVTASVDVSFLKKLVFDSVKFTLVFEYIFNLYVFPLPLELFFVLAIILLAMMKPLADREEKHKAARGCIDNSILFLSVGTILFSAIETVQHYNDFFTIANTKSLLLAPILTILYIPFFYLIAFYIQYETLRVNIECMFADKEKVSKTKRAIRRHVGLSITRLNNISCRFNKRNIYTDPSIDDYIKDISN
jgi:hypothetical protein